MTAKKRKNHIASTDGCKPTDRELAAVRKFMDKRSQRAPRLKVSKSGNCPTIALDHPDETIGLPHLMDALGTTDMDFFNGLVEQIARATSHGAELSEKRMNFMLSIIKDIEPRDQLEAMLAAPALPLNSWCGYSMPQIILPLETNVIHSTPPPHTGPRRGFACRPCSSGHLPARRFLHRYKILLHSFG
jgi:hypothetical protein